MTLSDYLVKFRQNKSKFAAKLGVNESALYKYISLEREPRLGVAIKIHTLSGGQVNYHDMLLNLQDVVFTELDTDLL